MSTSVRQDLVAIYKQETFKNLDLLNKVQPMIPALATQIFKGNALEKTTQNIFNNLSYYLLFIIDSQIHGTLTWPLLDTKAERAYRNEVASVISNYAAKGLLTPVMSSYLVNPSCYKVTVLIFQLSKLAIKNLLKSKLTGEKKNLYETMEEKYATSSPKEFLEHVENLDYKTTMFNKFSKFLYKKKCIEKIAKLFKDKIIEWERKTSKAQTFLDNIVDNYISKYELNEEAKNEILKIKNVNESTPFFDNCLLELDNKLDSIANNWDSGVVPFLYKCRYMQKVTESIVLRYTGQIDESAYTVEYDPKNDTIQTDDLQSQVTEREKFVLKNLYVEGRLNFPNLVCAFFISIRFILKNNEIGGEIDNFIKCLEGCEMNFKEAITKLRDVNERVSNAEAKLQPAVFVNTSQSVYTKKHSHIPPIPNLSNLKINKDHILFDAFTPLSLSKHQFNLKSRTNGAFVKPVSRPILTSFYHPPKEDFVKSLMSCHIHDYINQKASQHSHNLSVISNIKANDTIADCSSGFTRYQITKLLSTKKTSSSKKFKYRQERPDMEIRKGGLFNESFLSTESKGLIRSYSSPNLLEDREGRSFYKGLGRKLSIMQEHSPSQCDISGITSLNSKYNTPDVLHSSENSRKSCYSNTPMDIGSKIGNMANNADFTQGMQNIISPILELPRITMTPVKEEDMHTSKTETPKTNASLIRKSSSLEKIIKRFKTIRRNVIQEDKENEIGTILEEKENVNVNCTKFGSNKNLLPDLVSPSCSGMSVKYNMEDNDNTSFEIDKGVKRQTRQSLGTVLGVDQTFLEEFDLID